MAQARQHPAVIALLALAATGAAQAAPDAGACVAEHARVAEAQAESNGAAAARDAFAACARRGYGAAVEPRLERCTGDLYTLPVILLYRGESLSKVAALADLKRDEHFDAASRESRRALQMLDFAYQGAGPAEGQFEPWLNQRTVQWTDRCLRGAIPN